MIAEIMSPMTLPTLSSLSADGSKYGIAISRLGAMVTLGWPNPGTIGSAPNARPESDHCRKIVLFKLRHDPILAGLVAVAP